MKRTGFSLTTMLFILAFLLLLAGFFTFAARSSPSSRSATFKVAPDAPDAPKIEIKQKQ